MDKKKMVEKLRKVEKFIDDIYFGKTYYKDRIVYINDLLVEVINELEGKQTELVDG